MARKSVTGLYRRHLLQSPHRRIRRAVLDLLHHGYESGDLVSVHSALAIMFAHYGVVHQFRVQFTSPSALSSRHKRAVLGDTDVKTGLIRLIEPNQWRRRKRWGQDNLRGVRGWMRVAVHEAAHFMMLYHDEKQATDFERIVDGS